MPENRTAVWMPHDLHQRVIAVQIGLEARATQASGIPISLPLYRVVEAALDAANLPGDPQCQPETPSGSLHNSTDDS